MRRPFRASVAVLIIAACAVAVASIADASNGYLGVALADLPAGFAGRGAVVRDQRGQSLRK